jgi:hypothetical protein
MTSTEENNGLEQATPVANDLLDDIFGSSPPGPDGAVLQESTTTQPTTDTAHTAAAATVELSDLPSLRRQHVTAGYRDGVSFSKSQHVQRGFDAGFPVGAQFGLRVGTVLGILEGVLKGLDTTRSSSGPVKKRAATETKVAESEAEKEAREKNIEKVRQLYQMAARELSVGSVFGTVTGVVEGGDEEQEQEKPERQLARKADAIVSKWEKTVAVPKWEERMESLEAMDEVDDKKDNSGGPS